MSTSTLETKAIQKKVSSRCNICSKKLDLASRSTPCRCNHIFCSEHRLAEDHNCSFDFKASQMNKLSNELLSAKTSAHCKVEVI
jgi:hypothetical protein